MTQEKPIPAVPQWPNMLGYTIRSEGESPRKRFVVVAEYPDCTREFDGKVWTVTEDKRG